MNVTLRMEAVITPALTIMALSCVLVVQAILWQMMILAVMVIVFSVLLTMLIFFLKMWMNVLMKLMAVLRLVPITMDLSCVLVTQGILWLQIT